jgi:bifunctional DNA-binding transcriptional regulator/antitoxin component of YhaV-PrlF toxin-antitoxin module
MPYKLEPDHRRMDELTEGLPSKSAKMRRLAAEGYSRGDIARYIGVRYQFVYNVLAAAAPRTEVGSEKSAKEDVGGAMPASAPVAGEGPSESLVPTRGCVWTTVRKGGTIEFPIAFLQAMGVGKGDHVQLVSEGNVVRVLSRGAALRELQEEVRRYVPEGVSLVDELLAERRAEAAREMEGD